MRVFKVLIAMGLLALPGSSYAALPYGMAGCGLGSLIFGPNDLQTSAATTNQSFNNQAFGITFGTSNCVGGGSKSIFADVQKQFFTDNYATLAKEMAQGDGETLVTLATMFGCDAASYHAFAHTMQTSYKDIYAAPGAGASFNVIRTELKAHPDLASRCSMVI